MVVSSPQILIVDEKNAVSAVCSSAKSAIAKLSQAECIASCAKPISTAGILIRACESTPKVEPLLTSERLKKV